MGKRQGSRCALLLALLGGLMVAVAAEAEDELFVANDNVNSITVYSRTASGNTAPLRTLSGAATGLSSPRDLALDLTNNELFVGNLFDSVTVYSRTASGNTAPLRTLVGTATGLSLPRGLALDLTNNELFVANSGNGSITVYSRTASGNAAPLRTLSVGATGLSSPGGLALDLTNNELFVATNVPFAIAVYSRTASGNTAPLRTLSGAATELGIPGGLALDLTHSELFVGNDGNSITVYSRTASGDTAPLRTLSGEATGLGSGNLHPALDLTNNELFVAASSGPPSITVYSRTASGNTAPLRTLSGGGTGLSDPVGLAVTPKLSLVASVNQPTFSVGQTLTTSAILNDPGLPGSADLYLGALLPDGATIVFWTGGSNTAQGRLADLRTLRPYAAGVSLATPFFTNMPNFFSYQWTGTEPRGNYIFFHAAVTAGALADGVATNDEILALTTTPFSFP